MKLHEAVKAHDYKLFESLLNSGHDICEIGEYGDTVLHLLAKNKESTNVVSTIFSNLSSKANLNDWLFLIKCSLEKNIKTKHPMSDFAIVQNALSQTCMHVAIENENWEFASLMQSNHLHYFTNPERLKRNKDGLTEYELALVLYGIWGRTEQMNAVFGEMAKFRIQNLGYFSPFTKNNSIVYGLKEMKKALKAVKIITLPLKNGNNLDYILSTDSELFKYANENVYPSTFASFDEDKYLHSLYCHLNLAEHSNYTPPPPIQSDVYDEIEDKVRLGNYISWLVEHYGGDAPNNLYDLLVGMSDFLHVSKMDYGNQTVFFRSMIAYGINESSDATKTAILKTLIAFKNSLDSNRKISYNLLLDSYLTNWKSSGDFRT